MLLLRLQAASNIAQDVGQHPREHPSEGHPEQLACCDSRTHTSSTAKFARLGLSPDSTTAAAGVEPPAGGADGAPVAEPYVSSAGTAAIVHAQCVCGEALQLIMHFRLPLCAFAPLASGCCEH